jgi:ankyrin repeat protein
MLAFRPVKIHNKLEDYPLHNCAAKGDADGISRLLDSGWSVTQKDADSYTPIHYAAR